MFFIISMVMITGFTPFISAASVSPSHQRLEGTSAYANWTFNWNVSGLHAIRLTPGDGTKTRLIDSSNGTGSRKINHEYVSTDVIKYYTASFMAVSLVDGTAHIATANVTKAR